MKWYNKIPSWGYVVIALAIIAITAVIELLQGHTFISKSGVVQLWLGELNSPEGSQQITDWYTFSHIIHGFVFFWLLRLISRKKWPIGLLLVLAVGVEVAWEILENSPVIINRYREVTASFDYYGDSIINSMTDIFAMVAGFFMAKRFPVWVSILLVIAMEVGVGLVIHDNLTLNILMLVYPIEAVKAWQMSV
jgi:hypothetical protein